MEVNIRGLKNKHELEELFRFYRNVFVKTPLRFFSSRIINDPYLRLEDIRIAEENRSILSSLTIFRRRMWWHGKQVAFGGIGNVATLPERRGQGLSSKLLHDAIDYMREQSFPVSILFAGINSYYERFGYVIIPAYHVMFNIEDAPELTLQIRRFEKQDLEKVAHLYEKFNENLKGPIFRELDYWRANLTYAEENEIFLLAENNGEIEAYLRFVPGSRRGEIWEFAFSQINAFHDLLNHTAKFLGKKELRTAALLPQHFFQESSRVKISYLPSTLTMALMLQDKQDGDINKTIEHFTGFTFWWTDNF